MKALAFLSLVSLSSIASADTTVREAGTMPAIHGGIEVAVALGTSTSVGDIGDGMSARDAVGTAAQLELKIGRRFTPNLAVSFYTAAQGLAEGSTATRTVYTGTAGLVADLHLRPRTKIDPWIGVGGGLSAMLYDQDGVGLAVGVELARVQLGVDFRLTEDFALGPVIGASATMYGAERAPRADFVDYADRGVNWTFSAGIAGRFNKLGTRK
jgi:outer membrane protein W